MICRTIFVNIAFLLAAWFLLLMPIQAQNAPAKEPQNLLLNPDANEYSSHWIAFGDAIVEDAAGHENCFSLRNQGSFYQDVLVPPEMQGKYAVLLGLASSERINPDGAITGLPYLYGYMMADPVHIIAYLQGQQMPGSFRVPDEWGPIYGIFIIPPETTMIRFFLNQAERKGVPQNGSAARFDDLGLYILPKMSEAVRFVQNHFDLKEDLAALEFAQNQQNSQSKPRDSANSLSQNFVLEIKQIGAPTHYMPINAGIQYNPWDPNGNVLQSDWIKIQSSQLDHIVKVKISFISRSDSVSAIEGKYSERFMASYDLSIGQSVLISELEQLNLKPLQITVISQKPTHPSPLTVINRTASLEVVSVEEAVGKRYNILLKNNSRKKIIGVGFRSGEVRSSQMGTAIMPGSSQSIPWNSPSSIRPGVEYILNPEPSPVIISTVVFEDGSYEGEPEPAASYDVGHQLEKLHAILMIPVLNEASSRLETEAPEAVVQFLHDRLASFPQEVDSTLINSVLMKYPQLRITSQYRQMLEMTSKSRWQSLNTLEFRNLETNAMLKGAIDSKRLQTWLTAESDRCRRISEQR